MTEQHQLDRSWKKSMLAGLVLVMATAAAAGCSAVSAGEAGPKQVKVSKVQTMKMDDKTEQEADIIAYSQVNVVTKAGGDVAEVLKKRGDNVEAGDVLFRLDSTDAMRNKEKNRLAKQNLQSQLDKTSQDIVTNKGVLKNTIEKLQLQIVDLEKTYSSVHNDYDSGLVTKAQFDKAETQLKTAKLDLDTAQKQLANLESTDSLASLRIQIESTDLSMQDIDKSLADFEVKAPTSGVLTDLYPEKGVTVTAGYVAGVIQQLNPIKIHADVTESAAKLVRGKKDIAFTVPGSEEKLTASVEYLADVMSQPSKSFVLELSAANPDRKLKPGMRVKLQLGGDGKQDVLTVPQAALVKEGNDNYVFVLSGDVVEKRKVMLGRTSGTAREVTSGVKDGEAIVVSGQQELKDKDKAVVSN
ncbi:efflux RND transporter periplasmic adaptor subunit [Paenibacillus cremeus]|nr:efflux RND transporter periplasmic adaptor subunit [Paenibacillus cremeus]